MSTKVKGHQECGDCHPVQKNKKKRARREAQEEIATETIEERAERVARDFLGVSAEEAWQLWVTRKMKPGSVAYDEFRMLAWLAGR